MRYVANSGLFFTRRFQFGKYLHNSSSLFGCVLFGSVVVKYAV